MTNTLIFSGRVHTPYQVECGTGCGNQINTGLGCSASTSTNSLDFRFTPTAREFAKISTAEVPFAGGNNWVEAPLTWQFSTVDFLSISLSEGSQPIELLIGRPPILVGVSGTFPTNFIGGESVTFTVASEGATRASITVIFSVGDQTALQVAARINAQFVLNGLIPKAVIAGGQLQIQGDLPGAGQTLLVASGNATIGLSTGKLARGSGDPLTIVDNFVFGTASTPGSNFWLRGGGGTTVLNVLAAGS